MYQRLPQSYTPVRYDLYIHYSSLCPFEASVTITFQKNKDDDKILFNTNSNLVIKSVIQNNIPLEYVVDYPLLIIHRLKDSDQDISSYPITINYLLHPIKYNTNGFYEYSDNCYFTKFEPNYAQMLLPCFDEPCVRSTFSVKIRIPSNLVGISNMPVETSTTIENETEIKFLPTPPMCTYLLAIFVGDFGFIEGLTKSGTPVRMYAEKSRENILEKHLKVAIFALEWMEEKMGVKYELPILQLLSHPGISNGMENYGLIALRDYTRGFNFLRSCLTIMHEVSHLWFGDLVIIKWWDSVFLNEGFAQYFQYLILRDCFQEYSDKAIQMYIERDGTRCLDYFEDERVVVNEDEIDFSTRVLKSVIYIKGAFTLKMFSDIVGEVNFFKVCSVWNQTYKNKNADIADFISLVNNTLNEDHSDFFNTWLKKVGFPLLNVVELYDNDDQIVGIKITQSSFSSSIYKFKIPIVYEVDGEMKRMEVLMDEEEKEIFMKYDWILVNDGMESLCITIYSKFLISLLVDAKCKRKINSNNIDYIAKSHYQIFASDDYAIEPDVYEIVEEHFL